jgi:signal transduction histidine kinase
MSAAEPSELDAARATVVCEAAAVIGGVMLCEDDGFGRAQRPTAGYPAPFLVPEGALWRGSLLLRWLAANRRPLPVPDPTGVWDDLSDRDRDQLRAWQVAATVPLCHGRAMVAWLAVRHPAGYAEGALGRLMVNAPRWAAMLAQTREAAVAREQAESVARVQRLGLAGTLATQIAHEVRNPLAAARSATQLVIDRKVDEVEHPALLSGVLRDIDRATSALTQLLHLGRPRPWEVAACNVAQVAKNAVDFTHAFALRRGIAVTLEVGDVPLLTLGNASALSQVCVNLIMNACQASQPGQAVLVLLEHAPDGGIHLHVIDQGEGIPSEQLTRVFDAFFTTKAEGGGLGLTICRNVIEQHGGALRFESTPGHGTTATVVLPATGT